MLIVFVPILHISYWGRRKTLVVFMLIGGAACILIQLLGGETTTQWFFFMTLSVRLSVIDWAAVSRSRFVRQAVFREDNGFFKNFGGL